MKNEISSFKEFYPFYLSEHSNRICRRLHFVGTFLAILCLALFFLKKLPLFLVFALVCGYGFAWIGHFIFEKNKPASFKYPLYSLRGDFKMFYEILTGKINFVLFLSLISFSVSAYDGDEGVKSLFDVEMVSKCVESVGQKSAIACSGVKSLFDVEMVTQCVKAISSDAAKACKGVKTLHELKMVQECVKKVGLSAALACGA